MRFGLCSFVVGALLGWGIGQEILFGVGDEAPVAPKPKVRVSAVRLSMAGYRAQKIAPYSVKQDSPKPAARPKRKLRKPSAAPPPPPSSIAELIARGLGQ